MIELQLKEEILAKRHYFLTKGKKDKNASFYAAKLLNKYGIVVDKPELLTKDILSTISAFYEDSIPEGFYKNPQDTKYYSCEELFIEQILSYFKIDYLTGANSLDESTFERMPIFKKFIPNYEEGKEVKLRHFQIITEAEAEKLFKSIVLNYCEYTRPWAVDEEREMYYLICRGFYNNEHIKCKDNAITMFLKTNNTHFLKMVDKKDIVKLSVVLLGENKKFKLDKENKKIIKEGLKFSQDCMLTKKQAKYLNTLIKKTGAKIPKYSHKNSPNAVAKSFLRKGKIVEAAKVFANNGAMLERNLIWLLSRANANECKQILNLIKQDNPIVLTQLLLGLKRQNSKQERIFIFFKNHKLKSHSENDKELKLRKSILSDEIKKLVCKELENKIKKYYTSKKSLGKIYINPQFKKVAVPFNTTSMGMGLDVLPIGSRLKINGDYIRTFCYWNNAFDIDTSVIFVHESGELKTLYWGNSSKKLFGESALTSGDDRSKNGAEYIDFRIRELKKLGYTYAIFAINGYNSKLNEGNIYCGYQNKDNLNTKAWSPKNIEIKIHVKGDTRDYLGFAIDFNNNEIVILNTLQNGNNLVVNKAGYYQIKHLLDSNYLETMNMYKILSYCGKVVKSPKNADVVFDAEYQPNENQTVVRPFEIEKLVSLLK